MISLHELKERKLVQWALAYLAGGWLLLQVIDLVGGYFGWPPVIGQVATVLAAVGFLAALVLAWYHGEQGTQRVSGPELVMMTGILILAGAAVAFVGSPAPAALPAADDAAPTALPAPVAEQGSIAVLPFVNLSEDEDYFSDGLTEELLNVLAQLPELRVASRTSAFAFKDKDVGIDSIARALNVAHVLEGSVRRSGERIRITAQLINAGTGYHLWSETYDRELEDIFAVQDEISRAIVDQLQLELSGGRDRGPLARVETTDPEAHTLVLKAMQVGRQGTKEALAEVEALLKQALRRDPEYARAHAALASTYEFQAYAGYTSREEGLAMARAAAERALALDSTEERAHFMLGLLAGEYDWDWTAADRHYARAIELNPGLSTAYSQRAWLLMRLGRSEQALRLAGRAVELDPVASGTHNILGAMFSYAGQPERALESFQEALQLSPRSPVLLSNLAFSAAQLSRHEEAIRAGERAVEAASEYPAALAALAYAHARAGQTAHAEQVLARLEALPETRAYLVATVHAGLGNRAQVLRLLERAVEERDVNVLDLGVDPTFREYRTEPRVRHLLEQMGLPIGRS